MDPTQSSDAGATESYSKMADEAPAADDTGGSGVPDETLKSIDITITDNGGFIVRCQHTQKASSKGDVGAYQEPKSYAFGTREELDQFLDDKLGTPDKSGAAGGDEGEAGA